MRSSEVSQAEHFDVVAKSGEYCKTRPISLELIQAQQANVVEVEVDSLLTSGQPF